MGRQPFRQMKSDGTREEAGVSAGGESSLYDGVDIIDIPHCYLNQLYPFGNTEPTYGNPFTTYVQYYPFIAPKSGNVSKLGIRVSSYVSATNVQVGIYSDSNGSPTSLLGKVEISINSASHFDSTVFSDASGGSATITLAKGTQYWVGYMVNDSTVNNSLFGSLTSRRGTIYSGASSGTQASRVNVRSDNNATGLPATPSSPSGFWAFRIPQVYCVIG